MGDAGIDERTREGKLDPADLPEPSVLSRVDVVDGDLRVTWAAAPPSVHDSGWLHHVAEGRHRVDAAIPVPEHWSTRSMSEPPTMPGPTVLEGDDGALEEWLTLLCRFGIARLEGLPVDDDVVPRIGRRIGALRDTNFGVTWPVSVDLAPTSTANTPLPPAAPHRSADPGDAPRPPDSSTARSTPARGGFSTMADGYAVAERLRQAEPEHYEALTTLRWTFFNRSPDHDHRWSGPVIDEGAPGQPLTLRAFHPVPRVSRHGAGRHASGLRRAPAVLRWWPGSTEFQMRYAFRPGDLVAFDNRRILHGRTPIDADGGSRVLHGTYVDHDEIHSRLRVLTRRLAANSTDPTQTRRNPMSVFITCAVTGSGDTAGKSEHVPVTPEQIAAVRDRCGEGRGRGRALPRPRPADRSTRARRRPLPRGHRSHPVLRHRCRPQPHDRDGRRHRDRLGRATVAARPRRNRHGRGDRADGAHPRVQARDLHARRGVDELRRGQLHHVQHHGHARRDGPADPGARACGPSSSSSTPAISGTPRSMAERGPVRRPGARPAVHGDPVGRTERPELADGDGQQHPRRLGLLGVLDRAPISSAYVAAAMLAGGNVRVGLEDNLYLERGVKATNAMLVERAVQIIEAMNETVMSPAEVRERARPHEARMSTAASSPVVIERAAVVGAGVIGSAWAARFAAARHRREGPRPESRHTADPRRGVRQRPDAHGASSACRPPIEGRVTLVDSYDDACNDAQWVQESAPETHRDEARDPPRHRRRLRPRHRHRIVDVGDQAIRAPGRDVTPVATRGRPSVQSRVPAAARRGVCGGADGRRHRRPGDGVLRVRLDEAAPRAGRDRRLHRRPVARGGVAGVVVAGQRRCRDHRGDRRCDPLRLRSAVGADGPLRDVSGRRRARAAWPTSSASSGRRSRGPGPS